MAIKQLAKPTKQNTAKNESAVEKFISKGGTLTKSFDEPTDDHRLTLRIPKWLMDKVDTKRKGRIGKISRNLWILETLERAAKEE
jgi:hypothetical protein